MAELTQGVLNQDNFFLSQGLSAVYFKFLFPTPREEVLWESGEERLEVP